MRRDTVLRGLAEHRAEIAGFGVRSLAIVGSVARDEAGPKSDVDIPVEFAEPVGYFEFLDLQEYFAGILTRPVDLFTPDSLRREIYPEVKRDAIRVA